jgi:hypothetical protein
MKAMPMILDVLRFSLKQKKKTIDVKNGAKLNKLTIIEKFKSATLQR